MKKWLYFIAPVAGLVVFLFVYMTHVESAKKAAAEKIAAIQKADKEEADRKAKLEQIARADAAKKAAEREADEKKKDEERVAKWNEQGKKVADETAEAVKAVSELNAAIGTLDKEKASLLKSKEQFNRDYLKGSQDLELARIARRNAELEIQRLTELMIRKADESALAAQVAVATQPKKE